MFSNYITAWLEDQRQDYPDKFPSNFDVDTAIDQLNEWFDDQLVSDHLDDLLNKFLKKKSTQHLIDP